MKLPNLPTARLLLRPYVIQDAPTIQLMLDEQRLAAPMTGVSLAWADTQQVAHDSLAGIIYAISRQQDDVLVGNVSLLDIRVADQRAELGYWIDSEHWNQGYCTEALHTLMSFARHQLGISRITAHCLTHNTASIRVLEKCGLVAEGILRAHTKSGGQYHDTLSFGICWPERLSTEGALHQLVD